MLTRDAISTLCQERDYTFFQTKSFALLEKEADANILQEWQLFCKYLNKMSDPKPEKMLLMQTAFRCLENPMKKGELAQFLTLTRHLKSVDGLHLLHLLCSVRPGFLALSNYLTIFQLLIDLHDIPKLLHIVQSNLSFSHNLLRSALLDLQQEHFAAKYPERDLDTVLTTFSQKTEQIQFPLQPDELAAIKIDFLEIKKALVSYQSTPQATLLDDLWKFGTYWKASKFAAYAKQHNIAILVETIRRIYHICPYDTQIIALLGLLQTPEKLKGRIAQIKTGEGKSTIIAMLCAFMAAQGYCVDMITSSSYLAIRDSQKYEPFFKALGLSASHISHQDPEPKHFDAPILYGTNTDFEFAMLRDGLYNMKLRQKRSFDVAVIDEVDNLFLDTALNAAQMGVTDSSDIGWIYHPIWTFVTSKKENELITPTLIKNLRGFIQYHSPGKYHEALSKLSDLHLKRWFQSAHTACYTKREGRDYYIKDIDGKLTVTIVDYASTGRFQVGSQWQHGIHQFLQLKHGLKITAPSKTAASVSHPAYFGLYQYILGVTGTMGEAVERMEIETIYKVDTFDVPPHFPSLRKQKAASIFLSPNAQWDAIAQRILTKKEQGRPSLTLFKSIDESNAFSHFLNKGSIKKHQLLNDTQREAEDYIVAQAGEVGVVTISTNAAGRGTDVSLSPESKAIGGLHMIFTFYPDNRRVEDQGSGRAARQGCPGSCEMILQVQDEGIKSLIPLKEDYEGLPSKDIVSLLNQRRTDRIKQQSAQRLHSSQQEILYFAQLQTFFTKMAAVYTLMEDKAFEQRLVDCCSAYNSPFALPEQSSLTLNEPYWTPAIDMATTFTDQWAPLVIQFKEIYLTHVRSLWASFYSKLRDELEIENRDSAYQIVESYLHNPEAQIIKVLEAILHIATHNKNKTQSQENQYSMPLWNNYQNDTKTIAEQIGPLITNTYETKFAESFTFD